MGLDIIIPLGGGSTWNDNELRYCLRGIEMYLPHGKVWIVGRKPNWLTNVEFIEFSQSDKYNFASYNIAHKVMKVPIDGEFMFFNDDHFLLKPFNTNTYHYKGLLIENKNRSVYQNLIKNTYELLGKDAKDFDTHCPIKYNMTAFRYIMNNLDWTKPFGFGIKSVYCNRMRIEGEYYPDLKLSEPTTIENIKFKIKDRDYFSIGNGVINRSFIQFMEELYPIKSKYEND